MLALHALDGRKGHVFQGLLSGVAVEHRRNALIVISKLIVTKGVQETPEQMFGTGRMDTIQETPEQMFGTGRMDTM